jgi:hypothetical protein
LPERGEPVSTAVPNGQRAGSLKASTTWRLAEPQAGASFNLQVATPDGAAFDAALSGIRAVPGVRSVATGSLAVGGTSVLRVDFAGDAAALAAALRARGWQVSEAGNTLSISR